ncbi:hypothetical protein MAR_027909, partial [Mya arenaria]
TFSLTTTPNVLTQARDIGKNMRHKKDMSVSNDELKETFQTLIALLNEPVFGQEGQNAVAQLQMLQNDGILIDVEAIIETINESKALAVEEVKSEANAAFIQKHKDLVEFIEREKKELQRTIDEKASCSDPHGQTHSYEERKSGYLYETGDPEEQSEFDDLSSIIKDSSSSLNTIGIHLLSGQSRALDPFAYLNLHVEEE